MLPAVPTPRTLRFGLFELDLRSGELWKQGRKVRLEGQPVQILICLLERSGELVTRDELRERLWPADTYVNFEHGLNAAVKRLRRALNDSADSPRFVETLPRRGYRFLAPVESVRAEEGTPAFAEVTPDSPVSASDEPPHSGDVHKLEPVHWLLTWKKSAFALLLILAVLIVWMLRPKNSPSPVIRSLAVLPLENLSGGSQDYFSDGMTDELIT